MAGRYLGGAPPDAARRRRMRRSRRPGREPSAAYAAKLDALLLHDALAALWDFVGEANRFVEAEQPWALAKAAKARRRRRRRREARLAGVLGDLVEAVRLVSLAAAPFMPAIAPRALAQLGYAYRVRGRRQRRAAAPRGARVGRATPARRAPRDARRRSSRGSSRKRPTRLSIPRPPDRRSVTGASGARETEVGMSKHGEFSHIEFPADDVERAKSFYSSVFGWQFEAMDGIDGYFLYTAGPGDLGGGIGMRGENAPRRRSATTSRVDRCRCRGREGRAPTAAASSCPKTDIGVGWYAAVQGHRGQRARPVQVDAARADPSSAGRRAHPRRRCRGAPDRQSHCHLNAERFAGDEAAVLERARAAGVERILVPGWNLASCERALELVRALRLARRLGRRAPARRGEGRRRGLAADRRARGATRASSRSARPGSTTTASSRRSRTSSRTSGGTSRWRSRPASRRSSTSDPRPADATPRTRSSTSSRRRDSAAQASVAAFGADRPPAVIHSFSGSVDYARRVLDLGLAISISGLAFRTGEEATADVVPLVPADRLLVETDSPFLVAARRAAVAGTSPSGSASRPRGSAERRGDAAGALRRRRSSPPTTGRSVTGR